MVAEHQLIQFINCSQELKEQMKENFYQQKIKEAKDKKGTSIFNWDKIPFDIQQIIINYKEDMEYRESHIAPFYSRGGYISQVVKENHLTIKTFREYRCVEYKNEKGEGIKTLPSISWDFEKLIWIMINKKN